MTKTYIPVRFPKEAYENLQKKRKRMEEVVKQITGRNERIPLTKVLIAISKTPLTLHNEILLKLIRKKKVKRVKKIKVIQ